MDKGYAPDLSRQNFLHFGTEGLVSTFFVWFQMFLLTSTKSTLPGVWLEGLLRVSPSLF